jgi:hypothetical protein
MTDFGSEPATEGFTKEVDGGLFRREETRVELDVTCVVSASKSQKSPSGRVNLQLKDKS